MKDAGLDLPQSGVLDTCGTGGDGARSVNVSTASAVVVAACGVPVAKHGNRAASGNSGSAEVLAELGVAVEAEPTTLGRCLAELGIAFLFAPRFHPGLRPLAAVRKQLPFRTLFNLVGPLANPARPDYQLVGVAGEGPARLVAEALVQLGTRRAAVVTGLDGLDEVSLGAPTRVLVVERGAVSERLWEPSEFGLGPVSASELRVSGPAESAAKIRAMLAGEPGPVRDVVLANAAAALWVVGVGTLRDSVDRAAEAVDSSRAADLLRRWQSLSAGPVG
jgi:anthranilate phosphoribosyltransferase